MAVVPMHYLSSVSVVRLPFWRQYKLKSLKQTNLSDDLRENLASFFWACFLEGYDRIANPAKIASEIQNTAQVSVFYFVSLQ